jgi:hypothetical protein
MDLEKESESKTSVLEFEPQSFNFGIIIPGQEAKATLKVLGGSGSVNFSSDHFKVAPTSFNVEGSNIEITLLGGSSGELIWDDIILKTDAQEVRIPVTARWGVRELEKPVNTVTEPPVIQEAEPKVHPKEERTYKGRACLRCGKNFAYDIDSMSWEECTCNWFQITRNLSTRVYKDLRLGVKEFPSWVQEIWRIITGKEKW